MENPSEGEDKQFPQEHPNVPNSQGIYPTPTSGIGAPATPPPPPPSPPATGIVQNPVTADQSHNTHDGSHILQWLTFMFWGLTVLALSSLTTYVFQRLIVGTDLSTFNYYIIASLVILLPLAFVCDVIYAKQEPAKKIGASSRIMAGYSVIFALFAILALLSIAWNVVAWATGHGLNHNGSEAGIASGLFVFVYYLASFMRTLNPAHLRWITKTYRFTMLGVVIVFIILGFTKPTFGSKPAVSTSSSGQPSYSSPGSSYNSYSTTPRNKFDSSGKLEPSEVGYTQCAIPTLSDGSTTGQVAVTGGAVCNDAETVIQGAAGKNGGNYTANSFACTSTKQGSGTQWSSYWNNDFYSYNCTSGSKQVAFDLQTTAQSGSNSTYSPTITN